MARRVSGRGEYQADVGLASLGTTDDLSLHLHALWHVLGAAEANVAKRGTADGNVKAVNGVQVAVDGAEARRNLSQRI